MRNRIKRHLPVSAALLTLASVALAQAPQPKIVVPDKLKTAENERLAFILSAKGVQIYECQAKKDAAGQYEWAFRAPEADLFDAAGRRVGRHYAGPSWEAPDGSKTVGSLKERVDAPDPAAIPWLLLSAKSSGEGLFGKVTSIQRVSTTGGKAPASCSAKDVGNQARVDYTGDYYYYVAK